VDKSWGWVLKLEKKKACESKIVYERDEEEIWESKSGIEKIIEENEKIYR